jgi:hypothetical protein
MICEITVRELRCGSPGKKSRRKKKENVDNPLGGFVDSFRYSHTSPSLSDGRRFYLLFVRRLAGSLACLACLRVGRHV